VRSQREAPAIRLLEAHPDLRHGLDARHLSAAALHAVARTVDLRPGAWIPSPPHGSRRDHIAFLINQGALSRTVTLAGRTAIDLLGEEDLFRPWDEPADGTSVPAHVAWTVLRPTRLALLDERFAARVAPWPTISAALLARAVERSRRFARQLAILDHPRLDVRLFLLFWELADRWGTVAPDGVWVPLPLSHRVLGRVIRAQRPSVTAALGQLRERGFVSRAVDGSWILHGDARDQLRLLTSG
jgi:CRP/FNR family transcriptional regulator, cyclic AMP receptor protein